MASPDTDVLVLGPLLRWVGETAATVWLETARAATVTVRCGEGEWSAPTFGVEGHHYALVVLEGLEPSAARPYAVEVDGVSVWPQPNSPWPGPVIATIARSRPLRLAFGSCRTSVPHDAENHRSHGVDAMRTFALAMARGEVERPDLLALLGDQVYADETSDQMRTFIASRRSLDEPPWEELKDFEEYAHLYRVAWSEEANRWLLSTIPTSMIFDDHDIRDDWNTSWTWHEEINRQEWWHERLVGGLTSYWVYQHIGNLGPDELAGDEIYRLVLEHAASGDDTELDLTPALRDLVERNDRHPEVYRWSHFRELGESRLVVIDSRAARVLEPDHRSMIDPEELEWLRGKMRGDVEHLFVGTSVPFLLPPGLHDLEAISEVAASGHWGRRASQLAEKARQAIDLEHWAAFNGGFQDVFDIVSSVSRGEQGSSPGTVTFLSGDVHNSYVAEVEDDDGTLGRSRIIQAVCSPIRNPMPRAVRVLVSLMAKGMVRPMRALAGRSEKVADPPRPWDVKAGPWFDNTLAVLQVTNSGWEAVWWRGRIVDGDHDHPRLAAVSRVRVLSRDRDRQVQRPPREGDGAVDQLDARPPGSSDPLPRPTAGPQVAEDPAPERRQVNPA